MIQQMKFSGYFLIVWDFIRFAKRARHSGGPGPRLGRRQPGRLRDGDHRHRSAAVRAALRALPESGAHQHARHRHRFLHAPARRGDPVRHREVRPRAGGADHHLRHARRARRDQGRGPRARHDASPMSSASPSWCPNVLNIKLEGRHQAGAGLRRSGAEGSARRRGAGRRAAPGRHGAQRVGARRGRGDLARSR